jgi:hypothetical protein
MSIIVFINILWIPGGKYHIQVQTGLTKGSKIPIKYIKNNRDKRWQGSHHTAKTNATALKVSNQAEENSRYRKISTYTKEINLNSVPLDIKLGRALLCR